MQIVEHMRTRSVRTAVLLGAVTAAAACSSAAGSTPSREQPAEQEVVVLAAASLTGALTRLAEDVERDHPGVRVTLSFGGSSALARSIVDGAPADVFAAASPAAMRVVVAAGVARGEPVVVARNALQVAVPPGNPAGVVGLADFGRSELALAVCAEQVPCGEAAGRAFAAAGVVARPDTLEQDVKAVVAKVRTGEVDAGLVYATDVRAARGEVEGVQLPAEQRAPADYPVVVLRDAPHPGLAAEFVEALRSEQGRRVLAAAGFLPPA